MSKQPSVWRRKYIINLDFQGSFIQKSLFIAFTINVIFYFALEFVFIKFNIYGESLQHDARVKFYTFLKDQKEILNLTFLYVGSITALFIVFWGIFQSHRIAGPLFNLKLQLKKIKSAKNLKELSEVGVTKFRTSDYFHDLAEEYNQSIKHINKLLSENNVESLEQPELGNVEDFEAHKKNTTKKAA
ncbi:MAG: hypothetical protein QE271_14410 [Bacteriovoracaceae bacterium]|nr:hypothetical protein [Bacteriovoracaceae bacterium]